MGSHPTVLVRNIADVWCALNMRFRELDMIFERARERESERARERESERARDRETERPREPLFCCVTMFGARSI